MKTLYARHKWMQIVFGALFLLAGIAVIVIEYNWPDYTDRSLSVVLAVALFIFAAACIFSGVFSLKNKYFDPAFIYGDLAVALGVVLCVKNTMITEILVIFIGTILTTIGVVFLGEAVSMIFFKRPKPSIVLFFLLGALFLTLGILSYVFQQEALQIMFYGTGAVMCLVGVVQMVFGTVATIKAKKVAKDIADQNPVVIDNVDQEEVPQIVDVQPNEDNNNGNADA